MTKAEQVSTAALAKKYGLQADKNLGQHFLFDRNITDKIARQVTHLETGTTLEIGPGPGGLTRSLLVAGAHRLVVVERDHRCIALLAELAEEFPGKLRIMEGDALGIDEAELLASEPPPYRIVSNLPYNIGTALLVKWLQQIKPVYQSLTLMFQKEVALRITAQVDDEHYGRLAILSQFHAQTSRLFDLAPQAFVPPPKVYSSVVQLIPRENPPYPCDPAILEKVTAAAFGQRRKMLRQSLKSMVHDPLPWLNQAGIDPTRRAETLNLQEFCRLSEAYKSIAKPS